MTELEDSFAKLLGTQPSEKERKDLYRVRDALGLKSNDALWLVLMALQHYQSQYERFPARIEDAARKTLQTFDATVDARARAAAESARSQVERVAMSAAWDVVRKVETRVRLQWLSITLVSCATVLVLFAWLMHAMGQDTGRAIGYANGYHAAKDEQAVYSWLASAEGRAAYRLAEAGSILQLAQCAGSGWHIKDGVCLPGRAADGLHGWRVKPK